jgi:hypothetical protein
MEITKHFQATAGGEGIVEKLQAVNGELSVACSE